jgi:hypothetical protein
MIQPRRGGQGAFTPFPLHGKKVKIASLTLRKFTNSLSPPFFMPHNLAIKKFLRKEQK